MDARRKQVYNAIYVFDGYELKEVLPPATRIIDEVLDFVSKLDKKAVFLGDGIFVYKDAIDKCENAVIAPLNCNLQRAASVAAVAVVSAAASAANAGTADKATVAAHKTAIILFFIFLPPSN